jgi:hypothetical protein
MACAGVLAVRSKPDAQLTVIFPVNRRPPGPRVQDQAISVMIRLREKEVPSSGANPVCGLGTMSIFPARSASSQAGVNRTLGRRRPAQAAPI